MEVNFTREQIMDIVRPVRSAGDFMGSITGVASLNQAVPGDLSFLRGSKHLQELSATRASVVLVPEDFTGDPAPGQQFYWVENPSASLGQICSRIESAMWPKPDPGIHPSACVDPTAVVPASVTIGPHCVVEAGVILGERVHLQGQNFIGRNSTIGDESWLMPGVTIATECKVGRRVRLQPGVVIGADGFGYDSSAQGHARIPQVGIVEIGDDVEIGANSTVDRARFSRTSIGDGTKIDNLVQIGHNVVIGKHCIICSQAGIAGTCTLGDFIFLGGQVGLAGHLAIGSGAKVGAQSGISDDIGAGVVMNGTPALPLNAERRLLILYRRLPDIYRRLVALEDRTKDSE